MRKNLLRAVGSAPIELVDTYTLNPADGNYTVDVSGMTWGNGDIALMAVTSDQADAHTVSGWTAMGSAGAGNCHTYLFGRALQIGDTTFSTSDGNTLNGTTIVIAVFSNTAVPATVDTDTGTTGMPDAPASTVSTGASDYVIAIGGLDKDITGTAPTSYTMADQINDPGPGGSSSCMIAYITGVTGLENPAAFTGGGSGDWTGMTTVLSEA